MEQKSLNKKRRHHYIPITYLNKFTDISRNIFAYRRLTIDPTGRLMHENPVTL